ncbi:MAG TPA: SpoIIE family protein phosphatase [Candidatus Sulfopaludibacter sp.]|jgi:serine phosphatase RsbU (regulator of sigma subunit)|nr:SpoIIE family protein phosphatase [Candidatus Sulfopaludibacter sp.]
MAGTPGPQPAPPASLIVTDPNGHRTRVSLEPLPFSIGRGADSNLIIRDSRASRNHARILVEDGDYVLEDQGSRHGTFVNGSRVERHTLRNSDRVEFGAHDSYVLTFAPDGEELKRLMEQAGGVEKNSVPGVGSNLAKLRAILDLARTLQSSFSVDEVLAQVVDTALAITGAERGFLMLRGESGLETKVARHRKGHKLHDTDLRVPREVLQRALQHRRELLSMNFDPLVEGETRPQNSIADLELRSVICVPLVRIRTGQGEATSVLSTGAETVGLLYMDSRVVAADLAGGNRELLQTLAIEASTVLENARLLEEERGKHKMEEELQLARTIQQSLLPGKLPSEGWLRACGSSVASHEVGGDYFDVTKVNEKCWSVVVADVSGKGVSSALLASLLQGALIAATDHPEALRHRMEQLNRFLLGRTGGEKYATVFYSLLTLDGKLYYVNAAHCQPMIVRPGSVVEELETTGMPVGLVDGASFELAEYQLQDGDKVVIYSDGVSEAASSDGKFFGKKRLLEILNTHEHGSCGHIHDAIQLGVTKFAEDAPQSDDITVVVVEYHKAI